MTTTAPTQPAAHTNGASGHHAPSFSHGAAVHASPAVRAAIDTLVTQVTVASAHLTDARGPREGSKETYDAFMKRAADVRGRALLYPYLSSGLGRGALVELLDGSVKWDMISGIGVHFLGHSDPGMLAAAVEGALADTVQQGNLQSAFDGFEFGEALLAMTKRSSRLSHVYLSTSGAMANENAVKVCFQKHAPASRVIAFKDCFMGRSVTMSQIGDAAANRVGIPLSTLVDYMPFFDPLLAQRMGLARYIDMSVSHLMQYIERYPKQHACFIFELVQGEGGFNVGHRDFFKALMDVCKAHSIAVWDDEIQTFGRSPTSPLMYEHFDLGSYVDVFCVGKMTQVCATLFTPEYNPGPGLLSGTFIGGSTLFKTGKHVLDRLRDGDLYGPGETGKIARHHALFRQHAQALIAKHPNWFPPCAEVTDLVGGLGAMMRFTPFGGKKDPVTKACKHLFDEGVITFYCGHGPYHLRMLPPLAVLNESDWPKVFACIERGLAKAAP